MYYEAVIPMYSYSDFTKKYTSIGSGTLVEHRKYKYIITAAHVLDGLKGDALLIYFERTLYHVRAPAFVSKFSPFGSRDNDALDLAVIPLPLRLEIQSASRRFVTETDYMNGLKDSSSLYQIIGYPHAKNTKLANRTARIPCEFNTHAVRFTSQNIDAVALPHKNLSTEFHIATSLTKSAKAQKTGENITVPDLRGVSGGLLQKVSGYDVNSDGFDYAYPAGIILQRNRSKTAVYSLKLSCVFEWLDYHWLEFNTA